MNDNKLKVLVIAYACSPTKGSEHGVGWGWVKMIAKDCDVHVITAQRNRSDIDAYVDVDDDMSNVCFHYVEHKYSRTLDRAFPPYYLATYNHWLRKAYKSALSLKDEDFNLCHLVTYVGFRHPGPFCKLDMPFVWGPIGGMENTPWKVFSALGLFGSAYYLMRNVVNSIDRLFLPGPRAAFRKASESGAVIAATSGIQQEIRNWYGVDSKVICEVGPPDVDQPSHSKREHTGETFVISWSGSHTHGKALPLLLSALKQMPAECDWRLEILGEGPCRKAWARMSERMGIGERCRWHGRKTRVEALKIMAESHVFVITSLKDLTSSVLLEALSLGVPVVCLDHCGFSDVVDETCGVKIPLGTAKRMAAGMNEALAGLMRDESLRSMLAKGALARSAEYSWEKKRIQLAEIYAQVCEKEL